MGENLLRIRRGSFQGLGRVAVGKLREFPTDS